MKVIKDRYILNMIYQQRVKSIIKFKKSLEKGKIKNILINTKLDGMVFQNRKTHGSRFITSKICKIKSRSSIKNCKERKRSLANGATVAKD